MPSNHLILCCPLLLLPSISFPALGSFPMSQLFKSDGQSIGVSASASVLPMNIQDWLDLLAVQWTLKSLLQHHSSKASILLHSAFLIVQLSHLYVTTGKTIASTRWTFLGKVVSLLFIMLFRLVITFLPKSKHLLISWLQSPSAVILEPPQNLLEPKENQGEGTDQDHHGGSGISPGWPEGCSQRTQGACLQSIDHSFVWKGDTPCPRSGVAAMKRYPTSKVRGGGCTSLDQSWGDTPHPRSENPQ